MGGGLKILPELFVSKKEFCEVSELIKLTDFLPEDNKLSFSDK